jgi:Domain of unknown function (DUF4365)
MTESEYKQFTKQAKSGIKGEAFFESLITEHSLPHHVVGAKDLGIDYICEWVYGEKPTGNIYAVQVKTRSGKYLRPRDLGIIDSRNKLSTYEIQDDKLEIDKRTLLYWRGLGIPVYLFVVVYPDGEDQTGTFQCYYKRFTKVLTTATTNQAQESFYKVNEGSVFRAFADPEGKGKYGFARDLFVDLMRCSYSKGSIAWSDPASMGLEQFDSLNQVFSSLFREYREVICNTYMNTRQFLESECGRYFQSGGSPVQAIPTASPSVSPSASVSPSSSASPSSVMMNHRLSQR